MTKNSPSGVGIKAIILLVALLGVFYLMNQLQVFVTDPQVGERNPLGMLFGSDMGRPMNWCPEDVQRLQFEAALPEAITDPVQVQSYCQLLAESFDSTQLDVKTFRPILTAVGASGKEAILEADATGKVFRFQGLPFGSKQLSRQLEKKIHP